MSASVLLTREPVINKSHSITANRIITHGAKIADVTEALQAVTDVWPTQRTVFLSLGRLVPTPELLTWDVPDNTMVEIPAQTLAHPLTQQLIAELTERDISMCLSWFAPGTTQLPADLPWRFVLMDYRKHPDGSSAPGLPLAWGLSEIGAFGKAVAADFAGASGWFFLHGNPPPAKIQPSHAQLVRLLNLVRNNAEVKEIEAILKQDVALSYKLLSYINSAGFGLMCEVESFRHAVTILGYDALNKWLSLLLVTASRDPNAPAMMQTAIARGHFMETVGKAFFPKSELDNLFITGAFSLLHLLLGTSVQSVLDEMHLPESVTSALISGEGEIARFLRLAKAVEAFDNKALASAMDELAIEPSVINRAVIEGVRFADSIAA